ncbi:TPA: MFS transporter [Klebsiella pneumoniae]|nr:MFS transporter [Klebsiella pneumoniae]HDK6925079.1 MFS transporter [Klebsiella pneumoniae]
MSNSKLVNPWYVGIVSGMASYIDSAAIISNGTALVLYQEALGITPNQIGILSGVLTLCIAVGAFTGGRLGDCYGRRRIFLITMLAIILGTLLLTWGGAFGFLLIGTTLIGLGTGADLPVSLAAISEAADDHNRGKIIGLSNILWTVGICVTMAVASIVGGWGKLGAQIMYLHVCIVAAIIFILRCFIPESSMWLKAKSERQLGLATVRAKKSNYLDIFKGVYLWPFIALSLFYTLTNLAANTGGQFGAYVAVHYVGIPVETASLWGLMLLPVAIGSGALFMKIVDTNKRMPFFVIGAVFFSGGYFIPVVFNFSPASWFCSMLFIMLGNGLAFEGIMKVWAQESFPTMLRSTAQGLIVGIARLTCGILAFVTPALLKASPQLVFALLSTIVAVGMIIGWLCFHKGRRNEFNSEGELHHR